MKKTYVTIMPDKSGAFLKASEAIAAFGANITRVSYNKAVDTHTLFIEAEGEPEQLLRAEKELERIGYISDDSTRPKVILVEFRLRDIPGAVTPVLRLINGYHFNISYISSRANETGYQNFRMGLFIERPDKIKAFLDEAAGLCELRIVDYDESEKVLDNTVFYISFVNGIAEKLHLPEKDVSVLSADSNLIMQMLEEKDEPPYKTFGYIGSFADMLSRYRGEAFQPRISGRKLAGAALYVIEPPCGSNTYVIEKDGNLIFIDSGFACYRGEMKAVFHSLFTDFESRRKYGIVTHPDIDHCGLLDMFDRIFMSDEAYRNFELEAAGKPNFREEKAEHAPYCRISKVLSGYTTPPLEKLERVPCGAEDGSFVQPVGMEAGGLKFDFYAGNGGHARGEAVIVSEELRLVFTGDIAVNIAGFTEEQAKFNVLAPYLMTSVNMNSRLATAEREVLADRFPPEKYLYCCGHGAVLENVKNRGRGI